MARDDTMVMELRLRLNKAERDLARFVRKAERTDIKLKGIDHRKFTQPLGKITGSVSEFQKSLEASNARVIAFSASAGILMGVTKAFTEMARATIDVEKQLKDINVILGATNKNLQNFGRQLFGIASDTGQAFGVVAEAATEFARQGLSMEKTLLRTRDALILTRLSGMDATAAVNALTAAINSFGKSALTSTEIINRLANVDAAFAVSTNDLAEAIRRVGASADDVNVSFNELIAVVTSVQQTTARGGNVIGNSLKTIFTRIQRTEVVNQLKGLGVQVRDIQGNVRPAMKVLADFAKVYENLAPTIKAQTAELVGGVYQMNILKAILKDLKNDYSVFNQALETANGSTNEAILRNEELNKTLAALVNETTQNLTKLGASIGSLTLEPVFRQLLEGFNKLSEKSGAFGDIGALFGFGQKESEEFGGKLAKGILKSMGSLLQGPGFILIGTILGKLFLDFTKFLKDSVMDFMNLNKSAQQQAALQQQIRDTLASNPQLIDQITSKEQTRHQVEQKILASLREEIMLRERIDKISAGAGMRAMNRGYGANIDKSTGTTKLTHGNKHSGFIPNFSDISEYIGAVSGGYKPGDIKDMYIKGEGRVKYNTAERVVKFPGMAQEAIMPPEGSEAGMAYKKKFGGRHGFDPYASDGFLPNLMGVLTSMRTHVSNPTGGKTGSMSNMLKIPYANLTREGIDNGTKAWMKPIWRKALRPGEDVNLRTMGHQPTLQNQAGLSEGRGRGGHDRGLQVESRLAQRQGNFSFKDKFKAPGGKGTLPGLPVDLGTTSKTGRAYPIESKSKWASKTFAQLLHKTLYENNSQSLRQVKMRLKRKMDAGDPEAGAMLDKLQKQMGLYTGSQGKQLSEYTAGGITSLSAFNNEVGYNSKNAAQALRERQRGMGVFSRGFVPNFAGVRDVSSRVAMLVPEGVAEGPVSTPVYKTPKGTSVAYKFNSYDPDIPDGQKKNLSKLVETDIEKIANNYAKRFMNNPLNKEPDTSKYFNQGALKAATGAIFEASLDAAFQRSTDRQNATWDVKKGSSRAGDIFSLFGVPNAGHLGGNVHGDYKNSLSTGNLKSMAKKIWNTQNDEGWYKRDTKRVTGSGRKFGGHVPNFAALSDAVKTEAALGGKPVIDYDPRVGMYVRDGKSQNDFGDVLRDHPEGLTSAVRNSKKMQETIAAEGHVPNFQAGTNLDMGIITAGAGMMAMGLQQMIATNKEQAQGAQELDARMEALTQTTQELDQKSQDLTTAHDKGEQEIRSHSRAIKEDKQNLKKKKQELKKAEAGSAADTKTRAKMKRQAAAEARGTVTDIRTGKPVKLKDVKTLSRADKALLDARTRGNLIGLENKERKDRIERLKREKAQIQKSIKTKGQSIRTEVQNRTANEQLRTSINNERTAHQQNVAALKKEAAAHNKNATLMSGTSSAGQKAGVGTRLMNTAQGGAMGAMMITPMIGGGMRAAGVNESAAQGVEQGMGFAAMGAMTGNPYMAVGGALVGAGVAVNGVIKGMRTETEKFKNKAEEAAEKLTQFANNSQSFITNVEALNGLMMDPDADPNAIMKRQEALFESMNEMPTQFASKISNALGDTEKIQEVFADIRKDLEKAAKEAKFFQSMAAFDEKSFTFANNIKFAVSQAIASIPDQKNRNKKSAFVGTGPEASAARTDIARRMLTGGIMLNKGGDRQSWLDTTRSQGQAGMQRLEGLFGVNAMKNKNRTTYRGDITRFLGEINPEMSSDMKNLIADQSERDGRFGGLALLDRLKEFSNRAMDAADDTRKLQTHMSNLSKHTQLASQKMRNATEAMEMLQRSIGSIVNIATMQIEGRNKMLVNQESTLRAMGNLNIESSLKLASPFLGQESKAQLEDEQKRLRIQSKMIESMEQVTSTGQSKFLKSFNKEFIAASKTIRDLDAKKAKEGDLSSPEREQRRKAVDRQGLFKGLVSRIISETANKPLEMIPEIVKNMESELLKFGVSKAEIQALTYEVQELRQGSLQKLQEIIMTGNRDLIIQELRAKQQKDLIAQQKRLAFGGGAQGFMGGPRGGKITDIGRRRAMAELDPYQRTQKRGAADLNILNELVSKFGFNLRGGEFTGGNQGFNALIGSSIEGLSADIVDQLNRLEEAALVTTQNEQDRAKIGAAFDELRGKAGETAIDQIAKQLKLEELPMNVAKVAFNTRLMGELLADQQGRVKNANKEAFTDAMRTIGLHELPKANDTATWHDVGKNGNDAIAVKLESLVGTFNQVEKGRNKIGNLMYADNMMKEGLRDYNTDSAGRKEEARLQKQMRDSLSSMQQNFAAMEAELGTDISPERAAEIKKLKKTSGWKWIMSGQFLKDMFDPNISGVGFKELRTIDTTTRDFSDSAKIAEDVGVALQALRASGKGQRGQLELGYQGMGKMLEAHRMYKDNAEKNSPEFIHHEKAEKALMLEMEKNRQAYSKLGGNLKSLDTMDQEVAASRKKHLVAQAAQTQMIEFNKNQLEELGAQTKIAADATKAYAQSLLNKAKGLPGALAQGLFGGAQQSTTSSQSNIVVTGPSAPPAPVQTAQQVALNQQLSGTQLAIKAVTDARDARFGASGKKGAMGTWNKYDNPAWRDALTKSQGGKPAALTIADYESYIKGDNMSNLDMSKVLKRVPGAQTAYDREKEAYGINIKVLEEAAHVIKNQGKKAFATLSSPNSVAVKGSLSGKAIAMEMTPRSAADVARRQAKEILVSTDEPVVGGGGRIYTAPKGSKSAGQKFNDGWELVDDGLDNAVVRGGTQEDIERAINWLRRNPKVPGLDPIMGTPMDRSPIMVDPVRRQGHARGLRDEDDVHRMSYYRTAFTGRVGDQDIRSSLRRSAIAGQDVGPLEQGIRDKIEEILKKDLTRIDLNTGRVSYPGGTDARGERKNQIMTLGGQLQAIDVIKREIAAEGALLQKRKLIADARKNLTNQETDAATKAAAADLLKKFADEDMAAKVTSLTADLARARVEGHSYVEELAAIQQQIVDANIRRDEYSLVDSFAKLRDSMKYTGKELNRDFDSLVMNLGKSFEQGTVQAFQEAYRGNKKLKDSFGDLFKSLGRMVENEIIRISVKQGLSYMSGMFGAAASGGLVTASGVQKFAKGGLVEGGSGIKDDVPAMLSSGEYVIKKSSVNKYGASFLNALNSNEMPASSSTDPQANLNSLVSHAQSDSAMGAKFNMRNAFIYDSDKPTGASSYAIDTRLSRMALTDESNPRNRIRQEKVQNLFEYWAGRRQELTEWKKAVDEWKSERKSSVKRAAIMMGTGMLINSMFGKGTGFGSSGGTKQTLWDKGSKRFNNWRQERRWANDPMNAWDQDAQGGYKKDTVPSMLMGGEYVINANAVKRHGVGFFHALNAGRLRKMADGGYVGSESTIAPEGDLRGDTGMANNITINVNIDQNGDVTSDGGQIGPERGRELAKVIENQITSTLIKEKRQGGILHN